MKNSIPYIFAGAIGTLAIQALLKRYQKTDEVSVALERLKSSSGSLSVLPPKDLLSLVKAMEVLKVFEPLREAMEALEAMDISQNARDALGFLENELQNRLTHPEHPERNPEVDDSEQSNRERDWITDFFPRSSRPSFILLTPPSPADAAEGIDRQGRPDSTVISESTRTDSDGNTITERTTRGSDGTIKESSITTDRNGAIIASRVFLRDPNGFKTEVIQWEHGGFQVRHVYKDGHHDAFTRRTPTGPNEPWRRIPNEPAERRQGGAHTGGRRGGAHTGGLIDHLPTEDEIGGAPQFILKLKDGSYAQCVFINPITGIGSCSIFGRDEVNIDPENTPIIDATDMIIDARDLVVNPPLYNDIARERNPTPIPREVGPGARPPDDPV